MYFNTIQSINSVLVENQNKSQNNPEGIMVEIGIVAEYFPHMTPNRTTLWLEFVTHPVKFFVIIIIGRVGLGEETVKKSSNDYQLCLDRQRLIQTEAGFVTETVHCLVMI